MQITDILNQTGGLQSIARELGISEAEAASGAAALAPAILGGFQNQVQNQPGGEEGLGGLLGSIVGNAAGKTGLFVGGVVGGLLGAASSGIVASRRHWIPRSATFRTSAGAAIGFLAAALIATQTLGSPVGPILSTTLIGLGALAGAGRRHGPVV
jgi:hypothetical protein